MVSIGQKTLDVVNRFNAGMPIVDIAKELGITPSSVEKRLRSYKKFQAGGWAHKGVPEPTWTLEKVKEGFTRFLDEYGRLPTAYEIDDCDYLPSSRQIQRRFGGLAALREALGYGDIRFNAGDNKSASTKITNARGADAEDKLEALLIKQFGSLYVHSERRFGEGRKRVDFVVYAYEHTFAIDVFATNDMRTLVKNLDVKLPKYGDFPDTTPLYFLVWGDDIAQDQIDAMLLRSAKWSKYSWLRVVVLSTLLAEIDQLQPLDAPEGYKSMGVPPASVPFVGTMQSIN